MTLSMLLDEAKTLHRFCCRGRGGGICDDACPDPEEFPLDTSFCSVFGLNGGAFAL